MLMLLLNVVATIGYSQQIHCTSQTTPDGLCVFDNPSGGPGNIARPYATATAFNSGKGWGTYGGEVALYLLNGVTYSILIDPSNPEPTLQAVCKMIGSRAVQDEHGKWVSMTWNPATLNPSRPIRYISPDLNSVVTTPPQGSFALHEFGCYVPMTGRAGSTAQ
jgi:hypothetical protein